MVHCDLKPRNILLNADRTHAKIGDVGLARVMIESQLSTLSCLGTLNYAAPEVLLRKRCSSKVRRLVDCPVSRGDTGRKGEPYDR